MSFGDDTLHPDNAKAKADYERGFADALLWMSKLFRGCAEMVETPIYNDFESREGRKFRAIERTGQPHYAAKLRELATLLEHSVTRS
jgi:hypothetical protein